MSYKPTIHTGINKPYGMSQGGPTDARSYFYTESTFLYRPYNGTSEALGYLDQTRYREGNFSLFIKDPDTDEVEEWWFKDGTANEDLVKKENGAPPATVTPGLQAVIDADPLLTKDNIINLGTKKFSLINGAIETNNATTFRLNSQVIDAWGQLGADKQLLTSDAAGRAKWVNPPTPDNFEDGGIVFGSPTGAGITEKASLNYDNVNNRVGIGVAAPLARLDVAGSERLHNGSLTLYTVNEVGRVTITAPNDGQFPNPWTKDILIDQPTMQIRLNNGNTDGSGGGISRGASGQQNGNNYGELRIFSGMCSYGNAPNDVDQAFITFVVANTKMMGLQRQETFAESGVLKDNLTLDILAAQPAAGYPDDATASAAGIKKWGVYHNNGILRVCLI